MSGLAGILNWQQNLGSDRDILENMGVALQHRGADAGAVWQAEEVGFVYRHFANDRRNRDCFQPLVHEAGEHLYVIVCDGELYNAREVRRELTGRGAEFRTESDAEVLLHAYMEWGVDGLKRLNGIFAFAIWDGRRQQLCLGRDRMGVEPLFYAMRGSVTVFGSEVKALLQHPLVQPEVEAQGLTEIFALGMIRTPGETPFRDVKEVRPGCVVVVDRERVRNAPYWKLEVRPHEEDEAGTVQQVRELLLDIIERQVPSLDGVGSFLSGGLDSSGVTALLLQNKRLQEGRRLFTYSMDVHDSGLKQLAQLESIDLDDPWIERVSEYLRTEHVAVMIETPQLLAHQFAPMKAYDMPARGEIFSILPLVSQRTAQDARVVVSGEGSDEVFGAHPWSYETSLLEGSTFAWLPGNRFLGVAEDFIEKLRMNEYVHDRFREAQNEIPFLEGESSDERLVRAMGYLNVTRLLPFLMSRADCTSMGVGLQARYPFLDHRLVEYVWNMPWAIKNAGGEQKGVLRKALEAFLPSDVVWRKKSLIPWMTNPAYVSVVCEQMLAIADDADSPLRGMLDRAAIRELADRSVKAGHDVRVVGDVKRQFDYLVQVERWMKEYKVRVKL